MGHNCNLAIEFNGLVSKGVNRKIGPFYILKCLAKKLFFFAFFSSAELQKSSIICTKQRTQSRLHDLYEEQSSIKGLILSNEQSEDFFFLSELRL